MKVRRWFQEHPSRFAWEQDGLDHIRGLMPLTEPHRAWATFSFTAQSGWINECDLLIAVPRGLFLVELKAHPGLLTNRGDTWSFRDSHNRVRTLRNPLHLIDLKSKELKSQLTWAARKMNLRLPLPRVNPAIFLSDSSLESRLDPIQAQHVYGRDGISTGLPSVWEDLLGAVPDREEDRRVMAAFSHHLPLLISEIGIRAGTAHLDFGDSWRLADRPLDAGRPGERLQDAEGHYEAYAARHLCLPHVDSRALNGLKFSAALPERLAEATPAARLADLDGAAAALRETVRFTSV